MRSQGAFPVTGLNRPDGDGSRETGVRSHAIVRVAAASNETPVSRLPSPDCQAAPNSVFESFGRIEPGIRGTLHKTRSRTARHNALRYPPGPAPASPARPVLTPRPRDGAGKTLPLTGDP